MYITVNGESEAIRPCTIDQLVHHKRLNPQALVVEYNQQIVQQNQWSYIELKEGDTLELLSFVGGG